MRSARLPGIKALVIVGCALGAPVVATDDESPAAVRREAMRALAQATGAVETGAGTRADLIPEPIYRFDDPARAFGDGTIWGFGRSGRPAAIFCVSLAKWSRDRPIWLHEFTSLADGPVKAASQHPSGPWAWNTREPGVAFQPIAGAPRPAETAARRLGQMKELTRRFKAFEQEHPERNDPADRFELRLLPQPIHRYRDPDQGVVDGALFLLSYGRNPEIALVIEARRDGESDPMWAYSLARIAGARLRVSIDDREVADLPIPDSLGPSKAYYLFQRPATGLRD